MACHSALGDRNFALWLSQPPRLAYNEISARVDSQDTLKHPLILSHVPFL